MRIKHWSVQDSSTVLKFFWFFFPKTRDFVFKIEAKMFHRNTIVEIQIVFVKYGSQTTRNTTFKLLWHFLISSWLYHYDGVINSVYFLTYSTAKASLDTAPIELTRAFEPRIYKSFWYSWERDFIGILIFYNFKILHTVLSVDTLWILKVQRYSSCNDNRTLFLALRKASNSLLIESSSVWVNPSSSVIVT